MEADRKARNQEIALAVKRGQYIPPPMDTHSSFFPARPVIQKDRKEMARVYGEGETTD